MVPSTQHSCEGPSGLPAGTHHCMKMRIPCCKGPRRCRPAHPAAAPTRPLPLTAGRWPTGMLQQNRHPLSRSMVSFSHRGLQKQLPTFLAQATHLRARSACPGRMRPCNHWAQCINMPARADEYMFRYMLRASGGCQRQNQLQIALEYTAGPAQQLPGGLDGFSILPRFKSDSARLA